MSGLPLLNYLSGSGKLCRPLELSRVGVVRTGN